MRSTAPANVSRSSEYLAIHRAPAMPLRGTHVRSVDAPSAVSVVKTGARSSDVANEPASDAASAGGDTSPPMRVESWSSADDEMDPTPPNATTKPGLRQSNAWSA